MVNLLLPAAAALVAVLLVVLAVSAAVLILFTAPVFDLLGFHTIALDYFSGRVAREELAATVILGQRFSAAEISHLDDVGALLTTLSYLLVGAALGVFATIIAAPRVARHGATAALPAVAFAAVAIISAYFAFGFEAVGVFFHEVVFPAGNWRFPFTSLIIQLYGTEVMVTGATFAIAVAVGILLVAFVLGRRLTGARKL